MAFDVQKNVQVKSVVSITLVACVVSGADVSINEVPYMKTLVYITEILRIETVLTRHTIIFCHLSSPSSWLYNKCRKKIIFTVYIYIPGYYN